MSHHAHAQDLLALIAPAPAPAPGPAAQRGGDVFRLLMRREIAAGVALAGALDEKESAGRLARTRANLARAVQRRDRDLTAWQGSRAAASRVVEEAGRYIF